jgi:pseudouridylate synthase
MTSFIASPEVADALANGKPVVALESTIISHGLPRPRNLKLPKNLSKYFAPRELSQQQLQFLMEFQELVWMKMA